MSHRQYNQPHRRRCGLAGVLALAAVMLSAGPAWADEAEQEVEERLAEYWSPERDLPTLDSRAYARDGRFAVGLFGGLLPSEPFHWYIPLGARGSYHFANEYGVEIEGSYALARDTNLTEYIKGEDRYKQIEDLTVWRAHAMFTWHPLYGKLSVLQRKLSHFDFNVGVGLGVAGVDRPDVSNVEDVSSAVVPEMVFGAGVQFFATDALSIRVDGRGHVYQGAETATESSFGERLEAPIEFLLGVGYTF